MKDGLEHGLMLKMIGRISTDFPTKFGVPRQSGLVKEAKGVIFLEEEYRNPEAFRGLEEFSHIWVLWGFSETIRENWSPTVRPPRLGGNKRMGVFATRSPFRPNPIGLSSLKLDAIEINEKLGPLLHVSGVDMMDGTPIYDIKPYVAYADAHEMAVGGFADQVEKPRLEVDFPEDLMKIIPENRRKALVSVLTQDPRPSYQKDSHRLYGLEFAGFDIRFKVSENILRVYEVEKK